MNRRYALEVARWTIAIVVGIYLIRWAEAKMNSGSGFRIDIAFAIGIAFTLYGLLLFGMFGHSLINIVANRFAGLFFPDDSQIRIMPEYSVAEARAKEGRYPEAIEEYRQVIAKHPDDIYPRLRIAELALHHLNDVKLAELELTSACEKATGQDTTALAANRLADLYQHALHDPLRALNVMKQLRERIPNTKQARLAEERIVILEGVASGAMPTPKAPDKVSIRPSRYKMPE